MTTLNQAWIPADIDTVEKLYVWCSEILQYSYPNLLYTDSLDQNGEELKLRVIESNPFFLTAPEIPEYRCLLRGAVKLSPNHKLGGKLYQFALPFDNPSSPIAVPIEMRRAA